MVRLNTSDLDLPDVSVVIPNYNHGRYLENTIRSFLSQTHVPAEIIVVDDASTDDSWPTLLRLSDEIPKLTIIRRTTNGGVNTALADGIEIARSPLLVPASVDDVRLPNFLLESARMLARHPTAAFVFSDPAELDGVNGKITAFPKFISGQSSFFSPDVFARMQRRRSFRISANTTMFRRQLLVDIGGFQPRHHWHADWLAIMRLGMTHGVCYVPEVLCYFRLVAESYSSLSLKNEDSRAEVIVACLDSIYKSGNPALIGRFKDSAAMPEYSLSLLPELIHHESFRNHVTPTLIGWLIARQFWNWVRPFVSLRLRKMLRRMVNFR